MATSPGPFGARAALGNDHKKHSRSDDRHLKSQGRARPGQAAALNAVGPTFAELQPLRKLIVEKGLVLILREITSDELARFIEAVSAHPPEPFGK